MQTFAPVLVSEDRIIRTIVGLRPFRQSGFVVRTEKVGDRMVVHNYGHGGGGMTLSWGSSALAVEQALPLHSGNVAVLGAGGVGLAAARLLQQRGIAVTIYTKAIPPDTTSNVAGAQVFPVTIFDEPYRTPEFTEQFLRAAQISFSVFETFVGSRYGVRWISNFELSDRPQDHDFPYDPHGPLGAICPKYQRLTPAEHPFPVPYARRFDTMLIEPDIYLRALLDDFQLAGGKLVLREILDIADLASIPETVILNCTGLGSHALFQDEQLIPIKGQLTFLQPQPEVDYTVIYGDLYMFPRSDGILLGGTYERNNWSREPDPRVVNRIIAAHRRLFAR